MSRWVVRVVNEMENCKDACQSIYTGGYVKNPGQIERWLKCQV